MLVFALSFIAIDVYLALDRNDDGTLRNGNTYSEILRDWFKSKRVAGGFPWLYCLFSLALGVLMGHWGPK